MSAALAIAAAAGGIFVAMAIFVAVASANQIVRDQRLEDGGK